MNEISVILYNSIYGALGLSAAAALTASTPAVPFSHLGEKYNNALYSRVCTYARENRCLNSITKEYSTLEL